MGNERTAEHCRNQNISPDFPLLYSPPPSPPSLLGLWPSSTRIFFLSLHMCQRRRPTTAWNNRGRFIEGNVGHCVSFLCLSLLWPTPQFLQTDPSGLLDRGLSNSCIVFLDQPCFFSSGLTLVFLLLPCGTRCFFHATNPHPCAVLWACPACQAAVRCFASMYCSKACRVLCVGHALPVCRPHIGQVSAFLLPGLHTRLRLKMSPRGQNETVLSHSDVEADTVKAVWFPLSPALTLLLLIATVWKYCGLLKQEKWENTDGTASFFCSTWPIDLFWRLWFACLVAWLPIM